MEQNQSEETKLTTVDLFQTDGVNQQERLPLDFKRKLEAWEKMKGGIGARQCDEGAAEVSVETCRRDNSTEKKVYCFDYLINLIRIILLLKLPRSAPDPSSKSRSRRRT